MQGGAGGRPPWAWRARSVAETVVCVDRGLARTRSRTRVGCRATPKCSCEKTNKKNALAERTNKKGRTCTGDMGSPRCPYPRRSSGALRPIPHAACAQRPCACVVPCLSHMSSLPTLARLRFAATSKRHRAPWRRTWQPGSCDGSCPPASVCGEAIDGATPS